MTTPVFFEGTLPCEDAGTIDRVHQGIPLTAEGRVCISIDGTVSYVHNGVPFDSEGRVVVVDEGDTTRIKVAGRYYFLKTDGDIVGYFGGLPYGTPGGELGPSFSEYEASGTLALGDVVSLASPGVVEATDEAVASAGPRHTVSFSGLSPYGATAMAYDTTTNRVAMVYVDSNVIKAEIYDVVDGDLVYSGSDSNVYTEASETIQGTGFKACRDDNRNHTALLFRTYDGSDSRLKFVTITAINATSISTLSDRLVETAVGAANLADFIGVVNPTNGNFLVAYRSTVNPSGVKYYVFSSTRSSTKSVVRTLPSSDSMDMPYAGTFNSNQGTYVIVYSGSVGDLQVAAMDIPSYNSTPTTHGVHSRGDDIREDAAVWTVDGVFSAGGCAWGDDTADTVSHRMLFFTGDSNADFLSAETTLDSQSGLDARTVLAQPQLIDGTWYVGIFWCRNNDSNRWRFIVGEVTSATTISFPAPSAEFAIGNFILGSVVPTPSTNEPIVLTADGGTWNLRQFRLVDEVLSNSSEFVGIAQSAANDSETVLVATSGMIAEGLSGLTPGETYYVDTDGTLTTTDTGVEAGVAQSSTTLLVA